MWGFPYDASRSMDSAGNRPRDATTTTRTMNDG
jgi:hypothetical protein